MATNPTTLERDRMAAQKASEVKQITETEFEIKQKLRLETEIEKYDAERKVITKNLHDKNFINNTSPSQIRVMRRRRRWLKKERDQLKIKLDLMQK